MTQSLYRQLVMITEEYLGPAAPRFIDRQIAIHLGKAPNELVVDDLSKLAEWTKVTLGLLTEDRSVVAEYSDRIDQLAEESKLSPNGASHSRE